MKQTHRDEWRVIVTITPRRPADLGFDGVGELAEFVAAPGPIEVAVLPRRLGSLGFVSMGDSLASRDVEGDYRRRCDELLAELLSKPHVSEGRVACTETHTCSHCGLRWEELTADEAADPRSRLDEHSVEGEPVCCEKAIAEFRTERGIPAEGAVEDSGTAPGPASAIRVEPTDSGWRVRWRRGGRRRSKTLTTRRDADLYARYVAEGGESS
ncbi:hypothetical protein [Streptomyces sp. NPDC058266]|uniref:hypothetical protein n=1 Tax=Streptomyces sp. NPDC058266 TaxID=3346412 RepID=UPI0036E3DDEA